MLENDGWKMENRLVGSSGRQARRWKLTEQEVDFQGRQATTHNRENREYSKGNDANVAATTEHAQHKADTEMQRLFGTFG